jgi:ubiquitin-protein ligase
MAMQKVVPPDALAERTQRIKREIEKGYKSEQLEFFDDIDGVYGPKGNCYIRFWIKSGRYAGQVHILQVRFVYGDGYTNYKFPIKPPNITFITPIYHANVFVGGSICLDILRPDMWSPMQDIDSIYSSLMLLLESPNPKSPAFGEASKDYEKMSESDFTKKAMTYYLEQLKDANSKNAKAISLLTLNTFKTGIKDLSLRDTFCLPIKKHLGITF